MNLISTGQVEQSVPNQVTATNKPSYVTQTIKYTLMKIELYMYKQASPMSTQSVCDDQTTN
jgi:hypothetical protein